MMQNIPEIPFETANLGIESVLRGQVTSEAYNIQLSDVAWVEPGEAIFSPNNYCYLEWLPSPVKHLRGRYVDKSQDKPMQSIGQLMMIPPKRDLLTRWTQGQEQMLSCVIDINRLGLIGGFDWNWEDVELDQTLDFNNPFLTALMHRLAEETRAPGFASSLQVDSLLTLMAFELRRQFPALGTAETGNSDKLTTRQINTLREMIEESTGIGPSLATLASACNLMPRQLSEKFKLTTGGTLRQFVAENRIKKAKTLLVDRRLLIKEVAYLSGFQNAAAFTAAFRKATGKTPQEFRDIESVVRH